MWSVLLVALSLQASQAMPDPCQSYKSLNETHRSTGYVIHGPTEEALCDISLERGWYRFTSLAGGKMPEQCVGRFHCGTHAPIWLNGTHPDVADGIVDRVACANFGGTGRHPESPCCDISQHIGVKNCGGYFVYYLHPTPNACPVAYCAGTKVPCKTGQTSPTGLEPCVDIPTKPPTLGGPEIVGHTFRFTCNADFPENTDPHTVLDVAWTFDGQEDPNIPHGIILGQSGTASLPGSALKGHMGTNVGCKVRAMSTVDKNVTSSWLESNTYWAGVRPDPDTLEVSEKGGPAKITLTSTVPLVCDHDNACCISIVLDVHGDSNNVAMPDACIYKLCSKDWNNVTHEASVEIPVIASKDNVQDGNKTLQIRFHELLSAGGGSYLAAFDNHRINPVKVIATDGPTQKCSYTGDPHIHGMEYHGAYHLFDVGDYTMVENPHRHFEVQARTKRCGRVSCVCGIVIRERNDIVRIDQCNNQRHGHHCSPRITTPRHLSPGASIRRSRNGNTVVVKMPSGFELKAESHGHYMNVYSVIPSMDHGTARGICGTWDGNSRNEFTHRDGHVEAHPSRIPQQFTTSWSNSGSQSLFNTVPQEVLQSNETRYCSCDANGNGGPTVDCTKDAVTPTQRIQCPGSCQDVTTSNIPPFLQGTSWAKRAAVAVYADMDEPDTPYDPAQEQGQQTDWSTVSLDFPTGSGITQQDARSKCLQEMQKSQLWTYCQHNTEIRQGVLDDCESDILYSDSYDFLGSVTASFTTQCQVELSNDPNNYVTSADGKKVLLPEIASDVCDDVCSQHGRCERGKCICIPGYTGENCQLIDGMGPQLERIRGSNLCDINVKPCRKVFFDANNFEASDNFSCVVQEILPDGSLSRTEHTETAEMITSDRLACPLPDAQGRSLTRFSVKVTYDGQFYSNRMNITVYDSTCRDCSQADCPQLANTCLINNRCFQNTDLNPDDNNFMCLTQNSTDQWYGPAEGAYPHVSMPEVKLERSGAILRCSFQGAVSPTARYRIVWVTDRRIIQTATVTNDQDQGAEYFTSELDDSAALSGVQCGVCPYYESQDRSQDTCFKYSATKHIVVA